MRFEFRHIYIWLAISFVMSVLVAGNAFSDTQRSFTDIFFFPSKPAENIVLVKIDDESLREIGQWPWPRAVFAEMISVLDETSVIGIDVNFREQSRFGSEDDAVFRTALQNASPSVVLAAPLGNIENMSEVQRSFAENASYGFSNLAIDNDGTVRSMLVTQDEKPGFAYAVAQNAGQAHTPADPERPVRINYSGENETYPAVSFSDVLANPQSTALFRDRIVLIGVTASDLQNFHRTPFGFMSGVEIQANMVDTVQGGVFYFKSKALTIAAVVLVSFFTIAASISSRRFWLILSALVFIAVAYTAVVVVGFANFLILDLLYPLSALVLSALVTSISQYLVVSKRERAVRQSFSYLASMVESLQDGVVLTDKEMKIRVLNNAARKILQTSQKKRVTLSQCAEQLSDQLDLKKELSGGIAENTFRQVDDVLIDGRYFQVLAGPILERNSKEPRTIGGIIIFHDITQQKEVERIREDFISMMVHELRSPLDAIHRITSSLQDGDIEKPKRRDTYLELMENNASDMLTLVNDLLDVAKIEAGKFDIKKEQVDIRDIIKKRKEFFAQNAKEKEVAIKSKVAGDVPKRVSLDGTRIGQVLNNLLSNALKFVGEGGSVSIHAFPLGPNTSLAEAAQSRNVPYYTHVAKQSHAPNVRKLVIAVSDTGTGIAEEDLDELFNKFKQFEQTSKSKARGTGLGLAIIKGIVEAHKGSIVVSSEKGEGTTFFLLLPLSEGKVQKSAPLKSAKKKQTQTSSR